MQKLDHQSWKLRELKNDIILDPFLGSGATVIAAEELGHKWIGFELNPEYCRIAETRIAKARKQTKLSFTEGE